MRFILDTCLFGLLGVVVACGSGEPAGGGEGAGGDSGEAEPSGGAAGSGGSSEPGSGGSGGSAGAGDGEGGMGGSGGMNDHEIDPTKRVTARVVNRSGAPVAGFRIDIDGQSGVSDDDGTIVFFDVAETYDAWFISNGKNNVLIWQGVTRRDPVFKLASSATLSVTLDGVVTYSGEEPLPDEAPVQVGVICEDGNVATTTASAGGEYELALPWPEDVERSCQLLALVLDGGTPVAVALESLTLDGSSQLMGQDLELTANTPRTVSVDGANLSGMSPVPENMVAHANWGPFSLPPTTLGGDEFTLAVPVLETPVLTTVGGIDLGNNAVLTETLADDATSFTVDFGKVPTLVEPQPMTSVSDESSFVWTDPEDVGAYTMTLSLPGLNVIVRTRSTSIQLPDLAAAGIVVAPEALGSWSVTAASHPTSIDDLLVAASRPWPEKEYMSGAIPVVIE